MDGGTDARRITIHAPEDFGGMRAAGRLAAEALDMITEHVRPGVSTGTLDTLCYQFITAHGAVPATYMRDESPCQPSRITVTSIFRMSPFSSFRSPGMPWHTTWLIEVQIDFG